MHTLPDSRSNACEGLLLASLDLDLDEIASQSQPAACSLTQDRADYMYPQSAACLGFHARGGQSFQPGLGLLGPLCVFKYESN